MDNNENKQDALTDRLFPVLVGAIIGLALGIIGDFFVISNPVSGTVEGINRWGKPTTVTVPIIPPTIMLPIVGALAGLIWALIRKRSPGAASDE